LLNTLNFVISKLTTNKLVFRKWFLIYSKWTLSFIQRAEIKHNKENKEKRKKDTVKERTRKEIGNDRRNIRLLKWWDKKEGFETNWDGTGWVYALVSRVTGDWYIGSTKRSLDDRLKEHIYETERIWEKDKMERTVLHKAMWRIGLKNWFMVPLRRVKQEEQLRKLESFLIEKLKPNLNRRKKSKIDVERKKRRRPAKKNRDKRANRDEVDRRPLFWCWSIDGNESLDLEELLFQTRKPIIWQRGELDTTDWKLLERKYRIEVNIDQEFGDMKFLHKKMRSKEVGMIRIMTCVKRDREKEKEIRLEMKRNLAELRMEELVRLWRKRTLFKKAERTKMAKKINKEMLKRRGVAFPRNLRIKIPPMLSYGKKEMSKEIHEWINNLDTTTQWKKWLHEELRISEVRNRTVGDMLLNYKEFAKEDWFKVYKCTCERRAEGRKEDEHEIWKFEEKEKRIENLTTKTVIVPDGRMEVRLLRRRGMELMKTVGKIIGKEIQVPFRYKKRGWERSKMMDEINDIKQKWTNWVILERDKNNGAMALACPLWYRHKLLETFDWTKWRANYQKVCKNENQVLKYWKDTNERREKKMLWSIKCSLPFCFGIPKEKDISKLRPIISYARHPLRRQLNMVGRALLFALKKSGIRNLTLWKVEDIEGKLQRVNNMIKDWKKNEEINLKMQVYDVKEMYTSLPHNAIKDAVHKVTDRFRERCGEMITICGKRQKDIKLGRVSKGRQFGMEDIIETVIMDLNNAVFKCGSLTMIQTIGIPMGSPLSPALAIVTCAISEEKMLQEMLGNEKFVAMRYMDDIWLCTVERKEEREVDIRKLFSYYDHHLKIEKERDGDQVRFLDRMIIWNGKKLKTTEFNKNQTSLIEEGTRTFRNIIPAISFGCKKNKKAIIIGRLFRIQRSTMDKEDRFWQGWFTLTELKMLGYKPNILKDCCCWIDARFKENIWGFLFKCFMLVGKYYMSHPSIVSS